jgi:hypothetical protein
MSIATPAEARMKALFPCELVTSEEKRELAIRAVVEVVVFWRRVTPSKFHHQNNVSNKVFQILFSKD